MDKLLAQVRGKTLSLGERRDLSVELARLLLLDARKRRTLWDKVRDALTARLIRSPHLKQLTLELTDRSFRSKAYRPKKGRLLLPLIRLVMKTVILPGERRPLTRHIRKRTKEGVRINLNRLGEAILGEEEAKRRLKLYQEDLAQPDITYISIKISTLYSQLNLIAYPETLRELATRLRILLREALRHTPHKFVNLDMEEHRDLHLTVDLFQKVLDEPEFHRLSAGIVLQAYLPDSFPIQRKLTEWAQTRVARGGAPIKIRIVKGANLAMEIVEASQHHWPQAPYSTKAEADANFKRMVTYACEPAHAAAATVGIASHNLFDIAYALILRAEHQVEDHVVFEMLEGMAPPQQRALHALVGDTLLYCPAARKHEFAFAMAYLIRRLDENTAPQNFLRDLAGLHPDSPDWEAQADAFKRACEQMHATSHAPNRTQNRLTSPQDLPEHAPFSNDPPTDFSLPHNQRWARDLLTVQRPDTPPNLTWPQLDKALDTAQGAPFPNPAPHFRRARGELIQLMIADGKKTIAEADPEVCEAIDFIEFYRRQADHLRHDPEVDWTPCGTVLVASPWNFPLAIPTGGITAALAAGNAVLFKPAPEVTALGHRIAQLFWEAGVPKTALQFIPCAEEPEGSRLIQDPRIAAVILTGATSTARHFLTLRGDLPLFAETGGKNTLILSHLCDRDLAIADLIHSAFSHSGQKCSACSLALLHKELFDDPQFLRSLRDAVGSLPIGLPTTPTTRINPLIHPPQDPLLTALTTLQEGESWLLQPKQIAPDLWTPGIKIATHINPTEFFGPLLTLHRVRDLDHAIELANSTPYGLTAGLHSLDQDEWRHWIPRIIAGNLYINRPTTGAIVNRQPFGGCKASSFGPGAKAGGPHYLTQLMHPTQLTLPSHTASHPVESLLPPEDRPLFQASLGSYRHHARRLFTPTPTDYILGEENLFYLRPKPHVTLVSNGRPLDIARALCAAEICHAPITLENEDPTPWKEFFPLVPKPSHTYLRTLPALASGQYELLHYCREVSLSITTHRYGNLPLSAEVFV